MALGKTLSHEHLINTDFDSCRGDLASDTTNTSLQYNFHYFKSPSSTPATSHPLTLKLSTYQSSKNAYSRHGKALDIVSPNSLKAKKSVSSTNVSMSGSSNDLESCDGGHSLRNDDGKTNFSELITKSSEELNYLYKKLHEEKKCENQEANEEEAPPTAAEMKDDAMKDDAVPKSCDESEKEAIQKLFTENVLICQGKVNHNDSSHCKKERTQDNGSSSPRGISITFASGSGSGSGSALEQKDSDTDEGHQLKRCCSKIDLPNSFKEKALQDALRRKTSSTYKQIDIFGDGIQDQDQVLGQSLKEKDSLEFSLQSAPKEVCALSSCTEPKETVEKTYTYSKTLHPQEKPVTLPLHEKENISEPKSKESLSMQAPLKEEPLTSDDFKSEVLASPIKLNPQAEPFMLKEKHSNESISKPVETFSDAKDMPQTQEHQNYNENSGNDSHKNLFQETTVQISNDNIEKYGDSQCILSNDIEEKDDFTIIEDKKEQPITNDSESKCILMDKQSGGVYVEIDLLEKLQTPEQNTEPLEDNLSGHLKTDSDPVDCSMETNEKTSKTIVKETMVEETISASNILKTKVDKPVILEKANAGKIYLSSSLKKDKCGDNTVKETSRDTNTNKTKKSTFNRPSVNSVGIAYKKSTVVTSRQNKEEPAAFKKEKPVGSSLKKQEPLVSPHKKPICSRYSKSSLASVTTSCSSVAAKTRLSKSSFQSKPSCSASNAGRPDGKKPIIKGSSDRVHPKICNTSLGNTSSSNVNHNKNSLKSEDIDNNNSNIKKVNQKAFVETSSCSNIKQNEHSSSSSSKEPNNLQQKSQESISVPQNESKTSIEDNACGGATSSLGGESKEQPLPTSTSLESSGSGEGTQESNSSSKDNLRNFKYRLEELRGLLLPHLTVLTDSLTEQQKARLAAEVQTTTKDNVSVTLTITEAVAASLLNEKEINKNIILALAQMQKETELQKQRQMSQNQELDFNLKSDSSLEMDYSVSTLESTTIDSDLDQTATGQDKVEFLSDSISSPQQCSFTSKDSKSTNEGSSLNSSYSSSMWMALEQLLKTEKLLRKEQYNKTIDQNLAVPTSSTSPENSSESLKVEDKDSKNDSSSISTSTTNTNTLTSGTTLTTKEKLKIQQTASAALEHDTKASVSKLRSFPLQRPNPKNSLNISLKKGKGEAVSSTPRGENKVTGRLFTSATVNKTSDKKPLQNKKDLTLKKITDQQQKKTALSPKTPGKPNAADFSSSLHEKATLALTARKDTNNTFKVATTVTDDDKKRKGLSVEKVPLPSKRLLVPKIDVKTPVSISKRPKDINVKPTEPSKWSASKYATVNARVSSRLAAPKNDYKETTVKCALSSKKAITHAKIPSKSAALKCSETSDNEEKKESIEDLEKTTTARNLKEAKVSVNKDLGGAAALIQRKPEQKFSKAAPILTSVAASPKEEDNKSTAPFANLPNVLKHIMGASSDIPNYTNTESFNVNICGSVEGDDYSTKVKKTTDDYGAAAMSKCIVVEQEEKNPESKTYSKGITSGIILNKSKSPRGASNAAFIKSFSARERSNSSSKMAASKVDPKMMSQSARSNANTSNNRPTTSRRPSPTSARTKAPRETVASALRKIEAQKRQNLFPEDSGNDKEYNIKMSQYIFK